MAAFGNILSRGNIPIGELADRIACENVKHIVSMFARKRARQIGCLSDDENFIIAADTREAWVRAYRPVSRTKSTD